MKRFSIAFASILVATSALAQGTFVSERDRSSAMASANEDDGTDFLAIARREAKQQAAQQQAAQRAVPAGASVAAAQ